MQRLYYRKLPPLAISILLILLSASPVFAIQSHANGVSLDFSYVERNTNGTASYHYEIACEVDALAATLNATYGDGASLAWVATDTDSDGKLECNADGTSPIVLNTETSLSYLSLVVDGAVSVVIQRVVANGAAHYETVADPPAAQHFVFIPTILK